MKTNKILFFTLSVFILATFLSCNKKYSQTTNDDDKTGFFKLDEKKLSKLNKNIVMHIGHAQTEESPRHRSLVLFKEEVEKQSNGNIKVKIYPNGVVGDETQMTKSVSEGKLEAVRGGDLEFLPKSMLLGLPMIAENLSDARKLCYSDFVHNMLLDAESQNLYVLAVGDDSGFRQITNSERPITKPEDLKGLKIRAPQIQATVDFFTEVGAEATVVPFTELYAALAVGIVSGQENPLALIDSTKFYEVQSYCTIINYQFFPELMYVNKTWWDSLPKYYQALLTSCAKDMMEENGRITDQENEAYIKHIQENGCKVLTLSSEERAAFIPYAQNVWKKQIESGLASKEELEEMLGLVGKKPNW